MNINLKEYLLNFEHKMTGWTEEEIAASVEQKHLETHPSNESWSFVPSHIKNVWPILSLTERLMVVQTAYFSWQESERQVKITEEILAEQDGLSETD